MPRKACGALRPVRQQPLRRTRRLTTGRRFPSGSYGRKADEAEELYLDLLGTLIYAYEQVRVEMPALSGLELIQALLAERGLTQRDLVRAGVFATASVASEVLAGKRSLTTDQVRGLASFFRLPADFFLRETAAA